MSNKAHARTGSVMPWLEHYPPGITWDFEFDAPSLPDLFERTVIDHPEHTCTNFLGAEMSYAEISHWVDRVAAGLQQHGYGRGDRIGLLLPNTPYYVAAYFGILKAGATVVNFNPLYTVDELAQQAIDAGITLMVTLDARMLFDKAEALLEAGTIDKVVICPFADILPTTKSILFRLFKRNELANIGNSRFAERSIYWRDLVEGDGQLNPVAIKPTEDIALLQYTGGTTGVPKGAMLTHANLTTNVEQMVRWYPHVDIGAEIIMGILPFFHVFAMTTVLNFSIRTAASMILLPRFELKQAVQAIRSQRPTILPGVPTLYTALLDFDGIKPDHLNSLKFCISGGAPLPLDIRNRFEKFAGCKLVEGYGLSETSPVVACNPIDGIVKDNSIGQPVPGTVISIRSLDDPRIEMPLGESGEICIHGPQVMLGYWNRKKESADCFVDGFFRTGDVGYFDDQGFIYIIDRIKDMINCSGFKVYPRRIEEAIYTHPDVAEVTVIGVPDQYRGEAPKAFIKLKGGATASVEDMLAFLEPKLSKIEMPEHIEFRDELPKTMVGKLSKKELRDGS